MEDFIEDAKRAAQVPAAGIGCAAGGGLGKADEAVTA
jgi:hypothetical protein